MKIPTPTEPNRSELSVVPLVNVVFLLLVFFMLVGQITSPEPLNVRPPRSASGEDPSSSQSVRVLLTRDGQIAVERTVVREAQLTERVARVLASRPSASFQIKADARTEGVLLIRVMERLREAGVERLTLLTTEGSAQ